MQNHNCPSSLGPAYKRTPNGNFIDRSALMGEVDVIRCENCGHGVSHPPIPDVRFLYEGRGSQDFQPDARNSLSRLIKDVAFRQQAKKLLSEMGGVKGRLLDFGCGSGQFTRVLGETSHDLTVSGCDFFPEPPSELDEKSYISHDGLDEAKASYDGVLAMHVLEHDDDTRALLRRIVSPAKPGGLVVVEVPNVDCVWADIFGRYWDAWYLPYHRHHFSRMSFRSALEAEGLEIIKLSGITAPTMGRTFANLFGQKNNVFWVVLGIILHPLQLAGEALSGRRTALRAVCRKAG